MHQTNAFNIHLQMHIVINTDHWAHSEPSGELSLDISVPLDYFDTKNLAAYINKQIPDLIEQYHDQVNREDNTNDQS